MWDLGPTLRDAGNTILHAGSTPINWPWYSQSRWIYNILSFEYGCIDIGGECHLK